MRGCTAGLDLAESGNGSGDAPAASRRTECSPCTSSRPPSVNDGTVPAVFRGAAVESADAQRRLERDRYLDTMTYEEIARPASRRNGF